MLCVLQVSIGERDFVHDEEGPLRGQLDRPRLHGRHPTGEEVHLRRESVLHGIGVRVARRPGRPLLQRHPHGDHAEDLREHRRRKEVGLGSDSQFFSPTALSIISVGLLISLLLSKSALDVYVVWD